MYNNLLEEKFRLLFKRKTFSSRYEVFHFFILCGSLFFLLLGSGEGFRTCAYLNILFVINNLHNSYIQNRIHIITTKKILFIIWIPIAFMILDMFSGNGSPHRLDQYSKLLLVIFLMFGWLNFIENLTAQKLNVFLSTNVLSICLFVLIQFAVYAFIGTEWNASWHFGTFNNPHHLALFILLTGPLIFILALNNGGWKKLFLIFLLTISLWMLLKTSSRPAWLAILFGVISLIPFVSFKVRRLVLTLVIVLPLLLYVFSSQFHDRMLDLIMNISTEERVDIWKNTWLMLKQSSITEWLIGHGFNSYSAAYNVFTQLQGPQYTHPHNFILELLFTSGILGLLLAAILYFYLTKIFINLIHKVDAKNNFYVGKLSLAIFMMLSFHIFLTLPFYTTYNYYVLVMAYLVGHYFLYHHERYSKGLEH